MGVGRTGVKTGQPRAFMDRAVSFVGDDCLIWPHKKWRGYAVIALKCDDGKNRSFYVSRIICEKVHGPPPTPKHQAAHSCGNGHLGCISSGHLSWKTCKQNQHDKILHGTLVRGEHARHAKLNRNQVRQIRVLSKTKSRMEIAKQFGLTWYNVRDVITRRTWAWLRD